MTYILMIWTVVAMNANHIKNDWRPIGEFHSHTGKGQQLCHDAAKEMGIKSTDYRCVRSK
jgi:hypothetical protein